MWVSKDVISFETKVPSSDGKTSYVVAHGLSQFKNPPQTFDWSCTCPDFVHRKRVDGGYCKHIVEVMQLPVGRGGALLWYQNSTSNPVYLPANASVEIYLKSWHGKNNDPYRSEDTFTMLHPHVNVYVPIVQQGLTLPQAFWVEEVVKHSVHEFSNGLLVIVYVDDDEFPDEDAIVQQFASHFDLKATNAAPTVVVHSTPDLSNEDDGDSDDESDIFPVLADAPVCSDCDSDMAYTTSGYICDNPNCFRSPYHTLKQVDAQHTSGKPFKKPFGNK